MSRIHPTFCDDCGKLQDPGDFGMTPDCLCVPKWAGTRKALVEVLRERVAQEDHKQGTGDYLGILHEEFLEAQVEALKGNKTALRTELIQVAAVAVAWVEKLDRELDEDTSS